MTIESKNLNKFLAGIGNEKHSVKDYENNPVLPPKEISEGFVTSKGKNKFEVSGTTQKYVGDDGKLHDIQTSIMNEGALYGCETNNFKAYFDRDTKALVFQKGDAKIELSVEDKNSEALDPDIGHGTTGQLIDPDLTWHGQTASGVGMDVPGKPIVPGQESSPAALSSAPIVSDGSMSLPGLSDQFETSLTIDQQRLRMAFKLNKNPNDLEKDPCFAFHVQLTNCTAEMDEAGKDIWFQSASGEKLFHMPMPMAMDAVGYQQEPTLFSLTQVAKDKVDILVAVSLEWIQSYKTVLPVTITPFVEILQDNMIELQGYANGQKHESIDDRFVVGMKSGQKYDLVAFVKSANVVAQLERMELRDFKASLNFHYDRYEGSQDSQRFVVHVNDSEVLRTELPDESGTLSIDLTEALREQLLNRMERRKVSDIEVVISYDAPIPETTYLPSGQIVDSGKDCIEIYDNYTTEMEKRPSISLEHVDNGKHSEGMPFLRQSCGKSGTTEVNLFHQSVNHAIAEGAIGINRLSVPIAHRYDSRLLNPDSEKTPEGFGKGWMLSLSQRLVKSASYDKVLGAKKVTYFDGNNNRHELEERWFYFIGAIKHYVDKADVYIGNDQKLKCKDASGKIHDVEYESTNDEGLTFVEGAGAAGYDFKSDVKVHHEFYLMLADGKKEKLEVVDGMLRIPHFWDPSSSGVADPADFPNYKNYLTGGKFDVHVYINPELIKKEGENYYYGNDDVTGCIDYYLRPYKLHEAEETDEILVEALRYDKALFAKEGGKPLLTTSLSLLGIYITTEMVCSPSKSDSQKVDYHVTEEIAAVDQRIDALEDAIQQAGDQKEVLMNSIKSTTIQLEQCRLSQIGLDVSKAKSDALIAKGKQIYGCQKDYYAVVRDNERLYNEKEIAEASNPSRISPYYPPDDNKTEDDSKQRDATNDPIQNRTERMKGQNKIMNAGWDMNGELYGLKKATTSSGTDIGVDLLSQQATLSEDQANYNYELQKDNLVNNERALEAQIAGLRSQLRQLNETTTDYVSQLCHLKEQREALVADSKSQPTDFIVDKEGNYLGFDYQGRLVLMKDRYENEVDLIYEDDRLTQVLSEAQSARLHYDENDRLDYWTDFAGRRFEYRYDADGHLVSIKTKVERGEVHEILFTYDSDGRLASVEDPAGSKNMLTYDADGLVTGLRKTCSMKSVTAYGTTRLSTPEVLYDCTIQRDGEKATVTDNLKGRTVTMAFDVEGRTIYEKESFDGNTTFRAKAYDKDQEKMSIEYEPSNQLLTLPLSGVSTGYSMVKTFDVVDGYAGMGVIARSSLPENKLLAFVLHLSKEGITNPSFFSITLAVRLYDSRKYQVGETFQVTYDGNKDTDLAIAFRCDDWSQVAQIEFSFDAGLSQVVPAQTTMELFTAEGTIVQYDGEKVRKVFSDKGTAEFLDYQGDHPTRIETQSWGGTKKTLLYRYDDAGREIFSRDGDGLCQETLYDQDGRVVEIREYPEEDPNLCHKTKYRYDEKGNVQETEGPLRDESGNYPAVQKSYSPATGKLLLERHPSGQVLSYGYDAQTGDLLSITSDADGLGNTTRMRYDKGFLTQLTHHGFTFDYTYDGRGRKTKIDVADVTGYLAREYTDDYADADLDIEHGTKAVTAFKDDHTVTTVTDIRGRLRKSISDDVHDVTYQYDYSDNISSKTDSISGEKISFTYDSDGKQLSKTRTENSQQVFKEERDYDRQERLSERSLSLGEYGTLEESYDYDGKNLLSSVFLNKDGRNLLSLTYVRDLLGRAERFDVHSQGGEMLHGEIEYLHQDDHSTDYPKTLSVEMAGTEVLRESLAYDVMGRVTSVDTPDGKIIYAYDRLGRLVREDNPILGETTLWSYDSAGNIRSRKRGAYTTERKPSGMTDVSYNYADEGWKDRLMAFGLEKFVYDGMGRPTTYRDKNVTWNKDGTMSGFDGINFNYDMDGIRTSMVDGEEETSFVYDGSRILSMKGKDHDILFRYLGDVLVGAQIDGRECFYVKDAFGSVKALVDAQDGTVLARYVYDAWGLHKVLGNDGSELTDKEAIGNINPIRFRSYFYDSKTGLYYLIHRYYDSETGRFLSPDALSVLDEERLKINGLNLYAYCHDDPVDYVDSEGRGGILAFLGMVIFGAIVGTAGRFIGDVVVNVTNNGFDTSKWKWSTWQTYVGAAVGGAVFSALAGSSIGSSLLAYSGTIMGFTSSLATELLNVATGGSFNAGNIVVSTLGGALIDSVSSLFGTFSFVNKTYSQGLANAYRALANIPNQLTKTNLILMGKGFLNLAKYTFLTNFQMSSLLAVFTSELSMWLVENYPEWVFAD